MARASGDALFGIHMGDAVYLDERANSSASFVRAFRQQLESPTQAEMLAHLPVEHVYSDHDFGGNNAHGGSASGDAAVAAHIAFLPAPATPTLPPAGEAASSEEQAFLSHPCLQWKKAGQVRLVVPGGPKGQPGNNATVRVLRRSWVESAPACTSTALEASLARTKATEEGDGLGGHTGSVGRVGASAGDGGGAVDWAGPAASRAHRGPRGMQRAFSVNRVRFIVTDLRRFRDKNYAPDDG